MTINLSEIVEFIHNPLAYQEKLVSVINEKGEQIPLNYFNELYSYDNATIKIEGLERYSHDIWLKCKYYAMKYNHDGPVTCHGFIAKENSPSFGMHVDPDDVIIYCVEGIKTLIINDEYIKIEACDEVHISANTPHQALNEYAAFTLSFGLEKYLKDKQHNELDVLP